MNDLSPKEIEAWSEKFAEVYGGEWQEAVFAALAMFGMTVFLLFLTGFWR